MIVAKKSYAFFATVVFVLFFFFFYSIERGRMLFVCFLMLYRVHDMRHHLTGKVLKKHKKRAVEQRSDRRAM